jgi:hypothetical protein
MIKLVVIGSLWYIKALQANPRYSNAYNNLANICKDRNQYAEAI